MPEPSTLPHRTSTEWMGCSRKKVTQARIKDAPGPRGWDLERIMHFNAMHDHRIASTSLFYTNRMLALASKATGISVHGNELVPLWPPHLSCALPWLINGGQAGVPGFFSIPTSSTAVWFDQTRRHVLGWPRAVPRASRPHCPAQSSSPGPSQGAARGNLASQPVI